MLRDALALAAALFPPDVALMRNLRFRAILPAAAAISLLFAAGVALAAVELPDRMDAPPPRPATAPAAGQPAAPEPATAPEPAAMPADEIACRQRLREMGVAFEERERLSDPVGCLVEHPIAVTSLGRGIALAPEAVLNCSMALAAAEFAANVVSKEADRAFGSPLSAVTHASAYVCRARHGRTKMSEHAFGNALDISTFELKDGTRIEVKAYGAADPDRQAFIRTLRAQACGPFRTVLGPGSDADHALHLHLDLQQRRNGGTFCQ
jgi:hypothetical protein